MSRLRFFKEIVQHGWNLVDLPHLWYLVIIFVQDMLHI